MRRSLILLMLLAIPVGCNDANQTADETPFATPSPTPDPTTRVATAESKFQTDRNSDDSLRTQARQAAADLLYKIAPSWQIKGLSSHAYESNIFDVTANLEKDGRSVTVTLIVRRFFPENEEPYWYASGVDRSVAEQIHNLTDEAMRRELEALR